MGTGGVFASDSADDYSADETIMASRIEQLVHDIGGVSKAWVWVKIETNVDRFQEFVQDLFMKPKKPAAKKIASAPAVSMDILPGVNADEFAGLLRRKEQAALSRSVHPSGSSSKPADLESALKMAAWFRKISVRIAVPDSITPDRLQDLKTKIPVLAGLHPEQGDTFVIQTFPMVLPNSNAPHLSASERFLNWLGQVTPGMAATWLCILATILFFFGPIRNFLRDAAAALQVIRLQASSSTKNQEQTAKENPEEAKEKLTEPAAAEADVEGNGASSQELFAFITEEKLSNLIQIVRGETPEHVAMILSYLKPDWAAHVVSNLQEEKRQEVIALFTAEKNFEPAEVTAFAQKLQKSIDFVAGGPERLLRLLEDVPAETREEMLKELDRSFPDTARQVRSKLVTYADLFDLDGKVLKKLLWEAYRQKISLPILMSSMDAKKRQGMIDQLPDSIAEVVRAEMAAVASPAQENVEGEGRKLLQVARRLEQNGEIPPIRRKETVSQV
jgi:flagellar motor switch protein FliG